MGVAAKRTRTGAMIALKRTGELITDRRVARAFKIDKKDGAAEHSRKEIGVLAGEIRHGSRATRGCEREEELAFGLEGSEPCGERMRGAGAYDDDVGRVEWALRAIGVDNGDLRPEFERDAGSSRERCVDFDSDDLSLRAGEFGEYGGVIARAATKMKNMIAGVNVEHAEMKCPEAGLTIVQALGRVKHNECILVDVLGIGAFGEVLCAAGLNHPRAGSNETLAGHG